MSDERFTWNDCITCGVRFAMPTTLYETQRRKGGYHHCPNGHSQGWGKEESEEERTRRERDRLRQQIAQKDDEIAAAKRRTIEEMEARHKAERETARIKKRASGGICPCCNRHFTALERHMRTQHPEVTGKPKPVVKLKAV